MMVIGMGAVDAGRLAQIFHQLIAARHGAGKGAADPDVEFAGGRLAESGIKSDHFQDLDGFQTEFGGDPVDRFRLDISKLVLEQMQQRQDGTPG